MPDFVGISIKVVVTANDGVRLSILKIDPATISLVSFFHASSISFLNFLNLLFILHADHEQNASTSTVRLAASSGANPYACIAAGIASLWGPAHGGANEAVLHMLLEIGDVENVPK